LLRFLVFVATFRQKFSPKLLKPRCCLFWNHLEQT